ncbi:Uncharacterised protein [uncultured archaeon]|nr:Uncharacterised protein [uncultured archaeon]
MISGHTLVQGVACESKMFPEFFRANLCPLCLRWEGPCVHLKERTGRLPVTLEGGSICSHGSRLSPWNGLHPYGLWANVPPAAETPSFKCVEVNMRLLTLRSGDQRTIRDMGRAKA